MKVLVIDDNPVDVKLLSTVLGAAGYDVTGAPAAAAALAAIRREKPQVVLVDLALPGMDGMALVRQLKADPETRGIVVAAVTGHPSWWKKDEALDAGCDAYILKPVSTRELPQRVSAMAARKTEPNPPGGAVGLAPAPGKCTAHREVRPPRGVPDKHGVLEGKAPVARRRLAKAAAGPAKTTDPGPSSLTAGLLPDLPWPGTGGPDQARRR